MSNVEQKLQAMGLKLPACPAPVAAYLPVQTAGNLIYASGQTAWVDGKLLYAGKVGGDVSIADAYESAKISAVNCLSAIATVADLDHIRIVRVHGWVNGVPDFGDQPGFQIVGQQGQPAALQPVADPRGGGHLLQ